MAASRSHLPAVEMLAKLAQTRLRQTRFANPLTREDKTTPRAREAAPRARLIIRCAEIRLISAISFPYRYATAASAAGRRRIFLLAFHAFDDHFDLPQTFCIKTNTRLKLCVSPLSGSVRRNNNEARVHSSDARATCLFWWLGLRALRSPIRCCTIGETSRASFDARVN